MTYTQEHPVRSIFLAAFLLAGGVVTLLSGCSSFEQHKYVLWGDIVPQHPETLEDHWTDYGPFVPDDRSMKMRRGKAGVLRFYKKNDFERSIPVDGELVVYVFSGDDSGVELTEPKYKLVLDTEKLNRQRKFDKENGYSYHIWLDLGDVDQDPEPISILAVFTETKTHEQTASGITYTQIGGEPTEAKPQKETAKEEKAPELPNIARLPIPEYKPANAEEAVPETDAASNQVLSVNLSETLAERMAAAPAVQDTGSYEHRLPVKTAYSPAEPANLEPVHKKLTFEDLRTMGSPSFGQNQDYLSQGVADSQGNAVETKPQAETPNLLAPQPAGGAKVTYR